MTRLNSKPPHKETSKKGSGEPSKDSDQPMLISSFAKRTKWDASVASRML